MSRNVSLASKPALGLIAALLLTACQSANEKALDSAAAPAATDPTSTAAVVASDPAIASTPVEGSDTAQAGAAQETQIAALGATKPEAKANAMERYVPPAPGTVFTWRNNWSSLPPVISYKVEGVVRIGDAEYLKMTSVGGLKETINAYYDTSNFALKGYRDAKNEAVLTYKPVEERYRFPMKAGDRWVTSWRSYDHRKKKEIKGGGVVQVIGAELVELPAGSFKAYKVRMPMGPEMPKGMTHFVWFAPELGITVKEQIGNGTMNWTQILEKVELPSS